MFFLVKLAARYSPYIVLPVSAFLGFLGYKIESIVSDRYTPSLPSVNDRRVERQLAEERNVESLKERAFVPKTIFERNLSPSLNEPDPRLEKYKNVNQFSN